MNPLILSTFALIFLAFSLLLFIFLAFPNPIIYEKPKIPGRGFFHWKHVLLFWELSFIAKIFVVIWIPRFFL